MEDSRVDDLIEQVQSLTLQVQELKQELRRRDTSPSLRQRGQQLPYRTEFKPGDRVRILNSIRKPTSWNASKEWLPFQAKSATITSIKGQRVFFTTDNGVSTWRSPNNLAIINQNDKQLRQQHHH
jgi:hypothetical protein